MPRYSRDDVWRFVLGIGLGPFAIQLVLGLTLIFGDIGFDHPGRYGLDWDDLIKLLLAYGFFFLIGIVCSAAEGTWITLAVQILWAIGVCYWGEL